MPASKPSALLIELGAFAENHAATPFPGLMAAFKEAGYRSRLEEIDAVPQADGMALVRFKVYVSREDAAPELFDSLTVRVSAGPGPVSVVARKIAMTLRANAHMGAFAEKKTPLNLGRVLVSAIGLAIFNLFMVVPGLVYASLVAALYACAFAFYASGIVVASAGLAGVTEKVINNPLIYFVDGDEREDLLAKPARVTISSAGINVEEADLAKSDSDEDSGKDKPGIFKRAEEAATRQVSISTDLDTESRTLMSFAGLGLMVAGILLTMLSVLVTKFTLHGLRRYLEMNFSLLRAQ